MVTSGSCKAWAGSYLSQPLARKCEALAVNALAGYGDEIDVVAPVDILKQLFKTPYSKARLSLAVHRIGHTLILNSGYASCTFSVLATSRVCSRVIFALGIGNLLSQERLLCLMFNVVMSFWM